MIIAISKEVVKGEKRVSITPDIAEKFVKSGYSVWIEQGAGDLAGHPDELYSTSGAILIQDRKKLFSECDLLLGIHTPPKEYLLSLKKGAALFCFLWPLQHPETVDLLRNHGITAVSMDAVPRISRAQSMDALSSMSNISGYKAVLIGAMELDRYLPMMMTAAGTIRPAKVLVLGAGVAGLQAIATAKRLGAVVESYDVRPAVKEQVESLGATFIDIPIDDTDTETKGGYAKEVSEETKKKQVEVLHSHVQKSDVVITTALIPGKKAPVLITKTMVGDMKPGSVVVDIAAEQGGNCELTKAGETVFHNGVKVVGPVNLPSTVAQHASQMYAKNMHTLLSLYLKEGSFVVDASDQIVHESTITHAGELLSPLVKKQPSP